MGGVEEGGGVGIIQMGAMKMYTVQCIDENIFCTDHEVMIFDGSLAEDDVCDGNGNQVFHVTSVGKIPPFRFSF